MDHGVHGNLQGANRVRPQLRLEVGERRRREPVRLDAVGRQLGGRAVEAGLSSAVVATSSVPSRSNSTARPAPATTRSTNRG